MCMLTHSWLMRRQNSLGRNTCKDQVLAGAALHRKPGLQQILDSIRECAAGLVRMSPSDAFKAARLQWLRQMKQFPTVPAGQAFEKTCKGED